MMPNCWMPRIGMTRGGRCLLEFKSEDPLAIFFTSRVATLNAIPGTSALLARYRLEDSRTDPDVLDSVRGQFGRLTVPTRWRTTAGIAGRALAFDGTEDQIRCAGPDLDTNDFSVSLWVKVDRFHQGGIISQGGYCYERGWLLDYGAAGQGTVRFESGLAGTANGSLQTGLNALVPDGQWHHIVVSISRGGTSRLSIDGVVRATGSVAGGDLSNTNLAIAGLNNALCGGMVLFAGALDEVQIYDNALSTDEVSYLFSHPSAVIWVPDPPRLSYSLEGTSLSFTWDQDGYVLQKSADLNNPAAWSDVPGGNTSPAQADISPGQCFYRLRKQ